MTAPTCLRSQVERVAACFAMFMKYSCHPTRELIAAVLHAKSSTTESRGSRAQLQPASLWSAGALRSARKDTAWREPHRCRMAGRTEARSAREMDRLEE